jgi:sugar phosphate isomerase/epimerase
MMMKDVCALAERYGLTIFTENLPGNRLTRTGKELVRYIKDAGSPNLKAVFDLGHNSLMNLNPRNEIVDLGVDLQHLHIHDNHGKADEHIPLGEGTVDVDSFAEGLLRIGYKGIYLFEFVDCYEQCLNSSRSIMKKALENAAKSPEK